MAATDPNHRAIGLHKDATLAETVAALATTVNTLSARVEKIELMFEQFLGLMTKGKWFLFGGLFVVFGVVFGFAEALSKLKAFLK